MMPTLKRIKYSYEGRNDMKAVVFYGSPRKGNTYTATKIFMDEMSQCGEVSYSEFFLPKDVWNCQEMCSQKTPKI